MFVFHYFVLFPRLSMFILRKIYIVAGTLLFSHNCINQKLYTDRRAFGFDRPILLCWNTNIFDRNAISKYVGRVFDMWKRRTYFEYFEVLSRSCWISQWLTFKRYQALQVKCSCVLGSLLYYVHLTSKGRRKRLKSDEQILFTCLCTLAFLVVKRVRVIRGLKVEITLKKERNNLGRITSHGINFQKS